MASRSLCGSLENNSSSCNLQYCTIRMNGIACLCDVNIFPGQEVLSSDVSVLVSVFMGLWYIKPKKCHGTSWFMNRSTLANAGWHEPLGITLEWALRCDL